MAVYTPFIKTEPSITLIHWLGSHKSHYFLTLLRCKTVWQPNNKDELGRVEKHLSCSELKTT